jgi:hypothetical protein
MKRRGFLTALLGVAPAVVVGGAMTRAKAATMEPGGPLKWEIREVFSHVELGGTGDHTHSFTPMDHRNVWSVTTGVHPARVATKQVMFDGEKWIDL